MQPEAIEALIVVGGAVLLAAASVLVVRQVATKAEDRARLAQLEAQLPAIDTRAREALETAAAAKRIAARRKDREDREDARPASVEPHARPSRADADDDFRPGATRGFKLGGGGGGGGGEAAAAAAAALAARGLRVSPSGELETSAA